MEELIIETIKSTINDQGYIGDDCAVVELGSEKYLFSLDNLVEDVHFTQKLFNAYDLGWKAAAVNISDIAAMAGEPLFLMVGLSIPQNIARDLNWIKDFYQGIEAASKDSVYGSNLSSPKIIGGDVTNSKQISISIAIVGKAPGSRLMLRSGAKLSYKICVSGKFGNSNSYLNGLRDKAENEKYFKRPSARVALAQNIWKSCSEGVLMDSSDGLARSLIELSMRNRLRIELDSSAIPRDNFISLEEALYGGEDYELVGAFPQCPEGFTEIACFRPFLSETSDYELHDKTQNLDIDLSHIYNHFSA